MYILLCSDGSYYTGTARLGLEIRVAQHNARTYDGYTKTHRPVSLVFSEWFDNIIDAIAAERQVKGWSRAKKEALIRGDYGRLRELSGAPTAVRIELASIPSRPVFSRQAPTETLLRIRPELV